MNRLIVLSALTLAGTGSLALSRPEKFAETFGGSVDTPEDRQDIRAIHGAVPLAMAGLLLVRPSSAGTIGLLIAASAAGRAGGVAMEGIDPSSQITAGIAVEGGLAAALLLGRTQLAASRTASAIADKVTR